MKASPFPASGAFVIDKPEGLSSSQAVTRLKWALINHKIAGKSLKIGHGGTLDPFATGVLVVLFGEATKLADCYLHSKKTYTGTIRLGITTDSGDLTGEKTAERPVPPLSLAQWQQLANQFVDEPYFQTPPMHSAKKKDGVALYELARRGVEIEREPIRKTIHSFTLSNLHPDTIAFEVTCESGTYVRVLAYDLAKSAGTLAHLTTLRRTASSDRSIAESLPLDQTIEALEKHPESLPNLIPLEQLATHVPEIKIDSLRASRIRAGRVEAIQEFLEHPNRPGLEGRYVLIRDDSSLIALLERPAPQGPSRLQRVFNPQKPGV
ncbi:MAG: tRNA pseudouridine(55) synthase TruB [Bdellovibrionales bacterium]|nr:tRNA pseudouridine(55) synthase TruB [Bdellovibrionales bacterium]